MLRLYLFLPQPQPFITGWLEIVLTKLVICLKSLTKFVVVQESRSSVGRLSDHVCTVPWKGAPFILIVGLTISLLARTVSSVSRPP